MKTVNKHLTDHYRALININLKVKKYETFFNMSCLLGIANLYQDLSEQALILGSEVFTGSKENIL